MLQRGKIMREKERTVAILTAVIVCCLFTGCVTNGTEEQAAPQRVPMTSAPQKMNMTTVVPEGVATPDKLETRIGTLNLFDGIPDEATAQKVYDNLDFQRGVQAYLKLPSGRLVIRDAACLS